MPALVQHAPLYLLMHVVYTASLYHSRTYLSITTAMVKMKLNHVEKMDECDRHSPNGDNGNIQN